jgi:ornithine carbamoyltransferase
MILTFSHQLVEEMAQHAGVPVINGLTDFSHPCQAMADYLTMLEVKGRIAGLKVAYVGDGNNVAHSLMFAGAQLGANIWIATPPGYEPNLDALGWTRLRCHETKGRITTTHDPEMAVFSADVVYTDVWTSMGQETEAQKRLEIFRPYQVNAQLFASAKPDAIFLHCLPAHRGDEVTDDVIDGPRSFVFQQAENRLHAQKAILLGLMTGTAIEEQHEALREPMLELVR